MENSLFHGALSEVCVASAAYVEPALLTPALRRFLFSENVRISCGIYIILYNYYILNISLTNWTIGMKRFKYNVLNNNNFVV